MTNDPLYKEITDPAARKRALAVNIGFVVDEIIRTEGIDAIDLANKLNYVKRAVGEMQEI